MAEKIFVVTAGEYSEYHISRIFKTREAAEVYCAVTKWDDDPYIEEWELTDGIETDIEAVFKAIFFTFDERYSRIITWKFRYGTKPYELDIQRSRKEGYWTYSDVSGYIPVVDDVMDCEVVEKIIHDRVAQWKAEQVGL